MILTPDASSSPQAFAVFSWNRTKWFQYDAWTEVLTISFRPAGSASPLPLLMVNLTTGGGRARAAPDPVAGAVDPRGAVDRAPFERGDDLTAGDHHAGDAELVVDLGSGCVDALPLPLDVVERPDLLLEPPHRLRAFRMDLEADHVHLQLLLICLLEQLVPAALPVPAVVVEQPIDIALEISEAPPQQIQILAGVPHLEAIGFPVVAAHGAGGRRDQGGGELVADFVAPIVAEGRHATHRHALKAGRGGVGTEDRGRQLAPEIAHIAGELWKAEVHQTVELAHTVAEVLAPAVAKPDELAQFFRRSIRQPTGRWTLLGGEARDPHRIDRIGLGPVQTPPGEAAPPHRVQQADGKTSRDQRGEEILPVMARRLHGDQGVGGRAEHPEQLGVPIGVFGEGRRLNETAVSFAAPGDDMSPRCHIDAHEAHSHPFRRDRSGASPPVLLLTLVHARTPAAPQDPLRVLRTGRGRQSHNRGPSLKPPAATLSRIPSAYRYTRRPSRVGIVQAL